MKIFQKISLELRRSMKCMKNNEKNRLFDPGIKEF